MSIIRQEITVKGHHNFPIEMLARLHCWPATEADAYRIMQLTARNILRTKAPGCDGTIIVELHRHIYTDDPGHKHPLLDDRWSMYGWTIENVRLITVENAFDTEKINE